MTLAERLQRMLDERGSTVTEAAKSAGMEKQQVWRIVRGVNANPGYNTVQRIVEAIGGTMAELAADDPEERNPKKSRKSVD